MTRGIIEALSANAAGYRAVAVLAPARAHALAASQLAKLDGRLVLALGTGEPAVAATDRLARHLAATGRRPAVMDSMSGDLNDALVESSNWPRKLAAHLDQAIEAAGPPGRSLGR